MEMKNRVLLLMALTSLALPLAKTSRLLSAFENFHERFRASYARNQQLKKIVTDLSRQVMLQQFAIEEKSRSDGDSGIKLIRGGTKGLDNYDSNSHTGHYFMAVHDHSNYDRTIGLGELSAVLNGVEFRTRHNDYRMVMPSTTSGEIDAVEDVPFPGVPKEVTSKPTVEEQILEMREWFKAFWFQNTTHRDYPKYFKPVLAYLEGAWTLNKGLTESFASDRHHLDASSWFDLQEKNRFSAYSGVKTSLENLAILPTALMEVNTTTARGKYAQWNYRIMNWPLEDDLPLKYLQQVDDTAQRVSRRWTRVESLERRSARFRVYRGTDKQDYQLLDELMYQVPGKDNSYKNLSQAMFGDDGMYHFGYEENVKLDTGRYHRWYKSAQKDAMGSRSVARGYNDNYCFVAQTSQPSIASLTVEQCKGRKCETVENRFSYAIPLEIIYLTPLQTWNPYNLDIYQGFNYADRNGRDGSEDSYSLAYDGADLNHYYLTPAEFYSGFAEGDAADTVKGTVWVKAPDNKRYQTASSGPQILLQDIPGVGRVRTRFPIAPVHAEGSTVGKEVTALRDMLTGYHRAPPENVEFEMCNNGDHTHRFNITYKEYTRLINDRIVMDIVTEEVNGHSHELSFRFLKSMQRFQFVTCDGEMPCPDGHGKVITMLTNNVFTEVPIADNA